MSVALRPATGSDLDAVVAVFLACWRESYAAQLPERLVASMTDAGATALWGAVLERPDRTVVVAVDDDRVTGVVGFAPDGDVGTVHSLYVAPDAQGHGTGRALLDHAARQLARAGVREARLWVFADNAPSVRFYRGQGWAPDGTTRVEAEFGELELRLARSLEPTPTEVTA